MAALNLNNNNEMLSTDIEQLSTGLSINNASDNPAGYVVSQAMAGQLGGLNQATANSNDAINETQTAQSALNQVQNLLISMRSLAVQASNTGANDSTDLEADQTQIASAIQSINEISAYTQYGDKYLLNGSATAAMTTTAGSASASTAADFAVVSQGTWNASNAFAYSVNSLSTDTAATDTFGTTAFTNGTQFVGPSANAPTDGNIAFYGTININGTNYNVGTNNGTPAPDDLIALNSAIAASGYQASVNGAGNLVFTAQTSGITSEPSISLTHLSIMGNGSALDSPANQTTLNDVAQGTATTKAIITIPANTTPANLTQAGGQIDANATYTGTLSFTYTPAGGGPAKAFSATFAPGTTLADINTALTTQVNGALTATVSNGALVITSASDNDQITNYSASMNAYNTAASPTLSTFVQGTLPEMTINDASGANPLVSQSTQDVSGTYYYSFANGLVLSSSAAAGSSLNGTLSTTAGSTSIGTNLQFQIGANEGQDATESIQSIAADQLGAGAADYTDADGNQQTVLTQNVSDINVTTFKGAQDAIAVLDQAISQVSTIAANLGAFETNVLQSNVTSLGVATTNLQASEATVKDTDMATTITNYTQNSILVSAATSALSYADQMPQSILKLLQGA
jgi:flagellin